MFMRRNMLLLCGIVSIAMAQWPNVLLGQAKSDKGKATAKDQLKFEVYEDNAKEFRWRLVTGEDKDRQVLATGGQGYKAKADCMRGVKSIQEGSDKLKFETYEDNQKKIRWRAKASNGQVVAASASSYKAKADCQKAIDAIKAGAAKASVDDQSSK
jgi:hypothetical protein